MDGQRHERYFSRFSLATRKAVEFIVIDMYAPYVSLVKKFFPNAQLIIVRFHIVQRIGRTFLNHRVKETKSRLKSASQYQRELGGKMKCYSLL